MSTLQINDNSFYYEDHGAGEAIVLAHGLGGNHATWYQQVAVLAKAYRVITFDHRGFGNSSDNEAIGRSGFVSDLLALLDHLEISRAVLIGQSMGGGTVISFTARHPQRVAGLVIADSLHGLEESEEIAEIMHRARTETSKLNQLDRVLGESFRQNHNAKTVLYQQLNSFNQTHRGNLLGAYSDSKVSPAQLAELKLPVMFIAGQDDVLFPIKAIRLVQEQVSGSFLVEIDDCGHSAFYEKPVEFNDSLLSFLQIAGFEPVSGALHSNTSGYQKT